MPITEIAWMAGVIDLKGRLSVKGSMTRKSPLITLYVESKNEQVVRRLAKNTSLKPEAQMEKPLSEFIRRGCDVHCPAPHIHVSNTRENLAMPSMMRWTITGAGIAVIMHSMIGFLTEENQAKYADVARTILDDVTLEGQGSGMVVTSIRRLATMGWPIPYVLASAMEN